MTAWEPAQYEKFKRERAQPFFDLLALVRPEPDMRVVDLGCGTGELTRELHTTLRAKETLGIDTSEAMLEAARAHVAPGLSFSKGDLAGFRAAPPLDLVFSNAAVHWVKDHEGLFASLTESVRAGGQLAVQMPANHDHPSHAVAAEVARELPFAEIIREPRVSPVLPPEAYAKILDRLGYKEQSVRLQVYGHHLPSRDGVVEWVKGTTLTPYREALGEELYARFLERYRARLLPLLENTEPFFFAFKRILIWGRR